MQTRLLPLESLESGGLYRQWVGRRRRRSKVVQVEKRKSRSTGPGRVSRGKGRVVAAGQSLRGCVDDSRNPV